MFDFQHPVFVDVEPEVRKTVLKMLSTNVNQNVNSWKEVFKFEEKNGRYEIIFF